MRPARPTISELIEPWRLALGASAVERGRALRALYEGAAAGVELLAAASGKAASTIERQILREGWTAPTSTGLDERLARLADALVAQVESLRLEHEGAFDKGQVDLVSSILKTVEKIGELSRGTESEKVSQTKRDAETADVLARIDRRIIQLARDYARVLVAEKHK